MGLVELTHLSVRAPAQIAVAGVAQIGVGDRFEAARGMKLGGEFVGQGLVLDETVLARRPDRFFVEAHCIQVPAFEARDLGADQRRATVKVLRAVLGPERELRVMSRRALSRCCARSSADVLVSRRSRESGVEMVFGHSNCDGASRAAARL